MVFMTRSNNSEIDFFLTRMADRVICRDSDSMREFEYISYVNGHQILVLGDDKEN